MKYVLLFVFCLGISACSSQIKTKSITEISQKDIKTGTLVDVRTPQEFERGAVPNAVNINWMDAEFVTQVQAQVPKDKTVYVYCQAGVRSAKAAQKLKELGYTDIVELSDGYAAYPK